MIVKILVIALLVGLAFISKAIQDKISFHYEISIFRKKSAWWHPFKSWQFKWKNGDVTKGERFPGSSTVFVWVTDAWHFFEMVRLSCWQFGFSFLLFPVWWQILLSFLAVKVLHNFGFEILFRKVFSKP